MEQDHEDGDSASHAIGSDEERGLFEIDGVNLCMR